MEWSKLRFLVYDKLGRPRFFEKTSLLANTSIKVVPGIIFLSLSNANLQFGANKLIWRICIATKAIPTARQVELIDNHKFVRGPYQGL